MTRFVKRELLMVDPWSYGDWRQYVAFIDPEHAVCVRHSALPVVAFMAGVLLLAVALTGTFMGVHMPFTSFLAGWLLAPVVAALALRRRWVVDVGPVMKVGPDGSFWRTFPGEQDA